MHIMVMIDMQNDFIYGSLGSNAAQAVLPAACKKIKDSAHTNTPLFYTMDTHSDDYACTSEGKRLPVSHCLYGTKGWELPDVLASTLSERDLVYMVKKISFGTPLLPEAISQMLWQRNETAKKIEIFGVCTDICVISNAIILKGYFPEADIIVDGNCCAGTSEESHIRALEAMKMCHIDVKGS